MKLEQNVLDKKVYLRTVWGENRAIMFACKLWFLTEFSYETQVAELLGKQLEKWPTVKKEFLIFCQAFDISKSRKFRLLLSQLRRLKNSSPLRPAAAIQGASCCILTFIAREQ